MKIQLNVKNIPGDYPGDWDCEISFNIRTTDFQLSRKIEEAIRNALTIDDKYKKGE